MRHKDINNRSNAEGSMLRRDSDKLSAEIYDLRKEIDYQGARNADLGA